MNRSAQIRKALLLTITVLFASTSVAFSQADEQWKKQNDRGNRYEGRIGIPVGNPPLELLSFVGGSTAFPPGIPPDVTLKIKFFLPDASSAFIYGRELVEKRQYWMEAKQTSWQPQVWNEFAPWPTKDVLRREEIPLTNLGITVRLGAEKSNLLAPAVLSYEGALVPVPSYTLYLRPGATLKKVTYVLSRGDNGATVKTASLVQERLAGEPFSIVLNAQEIPEGRMHLKIIGVYKGQDGTPTVEYDFYHKPLR